MMFLIQFPAAAEVVQSQDYYLPHAGDCVFVVASIQPGGHIALDDVWLHAVGSNGVTSLYESLSSFNTSGDPYYRNVKFYDDSDLGNLSVGDALFFNKTIYWGGHFYLINSAGNRQFAQAEIVKTESIINLVIDYPMELGPPSAGAFLIGIPIIAVATLLGTAIIVRIFKINEEKRKNIWLIITAVMAILITLFIAAFLYSMVLTA
jgi:hypothetical protein